MQVALCSKIYIRTQDTLEHLSSAVYVNTRDNEFIKIRHLEYDVCMYAQPINDDLT